MQIGILHEGKYDRAPLEEIIRKILGDSRRELKFRTTSPGGSVHPHIKRAMALFIDVPPPCEVVIFFTDTDASRKKCKQLYEEAKEICDERGFTYYIVGCVDPHLEQWFLDEQNSVKNVFNLPAGQPIPFINDPKTTILKLIESSDDISETAEEIYEKIAKQMDTNMLQANQSFQNFKKNLGNIIKAQKASI